MPGPQPKPTVVKAAEGNPGKRRLNWHELKQKAKAPDPPDWLDTIARNKFRQLCRVLMERRIVREEDQIQLAILAQAYSTLRSAQQQLQKVKALVVKNGQHSFAANPLLYIIRDQVEIINKIAQQFGMSASARAKLPMREDDLPADLTMGAAVDPLEAMLAGTDESDPTDQAIVLQ